MKGNNEGKKKKIKREKKEEKKKIKKQKTVKIQEKNLMNLCILHWYFSKKFTNKRSEEILLKSFLKSHENHEFPNGSSNSFRKISVINYEKSALGEICKSKSYENVIRN